MITIIGGDGKAYGPVPVDQVRRWIQEGRATVDTQARREGETEWRRLGDMPEFNPEPPQFAPPLEPQAPAPEPEAPSAPSYQPFQVPVPVTPVFTQSAPKAPVPANRGLRLLAAFIDTIISMVFAIPGMIMIATRIVAAGGKMPAFGSPEFATLAGGFLVVVLGELILMAIQGWMLTTRGQTIGKKLLGIRIVSNTDGGNPGFVHAVLLRAVVTTILANIPWLGILFWIVDVCFIFREDRRCLHDLIADTKVVEE